MFLAHKHKHLNSYACSGQQICEISSLFQFSTVMSTPLVLLDTRRSFRHLHQIMTEYTMLCIFFKKQSAKMMNLSSYSSSNSFSSNLWFGWPQDCRLEKVSQTEALSSTEYQRHLYVTYKDNKYSSIIDSRYNLVSRKLRFVSKLQKPFCCNRIWESVNTFGNAVRLIIMRIQNG